jgi:putative ABC transport system permease protein
LLRNITRGLQSLFRREQVDQQLDEELRAYQEMATEEKMRNGMSRKEALRAVRLESGTLEASKEIVRSGGWEYFVDTCWQDLRYGARTLRKSPGFTIVAVLTLAVGIGANTAIFSVIDGVLIAPLPYKNPEQLLAMRPNDAPMNLIDVERQAQTFSQGGAINVDEMDYTSGVEPVQVRVAYVNAGFLETLGVPPMLGRAISGDEDVKGARRVVDVSYSFWQNFLSGDPRALGKTVRLGGSDYTVIGVMPADFALPRERADIFVSLQVAYPEAASDRGVHFMHSYWRLKPGATLAQAQAEMVAIDRRLSEQYPDTERDRRKMLVPLREVVTGDVRPALLILFGAVGFVLLIACANFAGLLVAQGVARKQELVIRAALGAGKVRLMRQVLTESLVLSLAGGLAGLFLARWSTAILLSLKPAALARFTNIFIDARVLAFALGVSLLTGIVFGIIPAWSVARAGFAESMKEGGRTTTGGRSGHMLRSILVITEFALALVLLVGAGLLLRAFSHLRSVNPGFNPQNLTTMYMQLPQSRYREIPRQTQFRRQLLAGLNSLSGVEAAMITDIPFGGNYVDHAVVVDGRPPLPVGSEPDAQTVSVMGDYFGVMQIPVRAGRPFSEMDREGQPLVAVVNEQFVKRFFPHENPLGARVDWARSDPPRKWMTIVGVVSDVRHSDLSQPQDPAVYTPFSQSDERWRHFMTVVIRSSRPAGDLAAEVKRQAWNIDRQIPVSLVQSMDELMGVSLAQQRFNMSLLGLFAMIALVLAAVGIYGLMSYAVSQRTHEIGIRVAIGAQHRDVLGLVVAEGTRLALLGIVVGVALAIVVTRFMTSLLFEVAPTDPMTFAGVALLLALTGLLACYIPARRAMRVDPMVALRYE